MHCPDCGSIGSYQGIGQAGDVWTGHRFASRYCPHCEHSYRVPLPGSIQ